ncbi:hypothetical protein [Pedobacter sp. JY14-1]|uniref:hypothetical protein n=1 Tax=Pedobacter sp. JY14-1 TaxID=3034151 RepID=UPI0023E29382|nr:hypothetical protein [Pedobacter sp. JY14-1]
MIDLFRANFPDHTFHEENSEELFIVDLKPLRLGAEVVMLNTRPIHAHVHLFNPRQVPLFFDGFPDNSFQIAPGNHLKQCECVIFPQTCEQEDWVLFIETKYTENIETAFDEVIDYPNGMINQIVTTVNFLRDNGIIPTNKRVHALVSFPRLIEDFNAFFFTSTPSEIDILTDYNIIIRASNKATIRSNRRIHLSVIKHFGA